MLSVSNKLSREQLSFLPAVLEIESTPPNASSRIILWAVILKVIVFIVWACFSQVDITAKAQGKLTPSSQVKIVQPLNTGLVKQIHVFEGKRVNKGDLLVTLDTTITESELNRLKIQLQDVKEDILKTELLQWMVQNKVNSLPYSSMDEYDERIKFLSGLQKQSLVTIWTEYQQKQLNIHRQIDKLKAESVTSTLNINRIEKMIPLINEQVDSVKKLLEKSLVSRSHFLELELNRISHVDSLAIEKAKLEQISASISEVEQQKHILKAEFQMNLTESLKQYQRQQVLLRQEIIKANNSNDQHQLIASESGTIEQLSVTTIGGVVTPAQELMRIVPNDQPMIAEAWLLNKDIGFVEVGHIAEVKIESFEFTKYGVIEASIIEISTDAIEKEGVGLVFPIKAKLKLNTIRAGDKTVPLGPGMAVTLEVKTGERRVIDFLLSPVIKSVSESIKER